MHIRGQAALEFLSTYGFAFLIILVMIGALSFFGVLNPQNLIPNRCNFPPDFNCFEYEVVKDPALGNATLNVVLLNQLGNTITFNNAAGSNNATSQYGYGSCAFSSLSLVGGDRATVSCNMDIGPTGVVGGAVFPAKGQKVKVDLSIQYQQLGRQYWVPVTGEVLSTLI